MPMRAGDRRHASSTSDGEPNFVPEAYRRSSGLIPTRFQGSDIVVLVGQAFCLSERDRQDACPTSTYLRSWLI